MGPDRHHDPSDGDLEIRTFDFIPVSVATISGRNRSAQRVAEGNALLTWDQNALASAYRRPS